MTTIDSIYASNFIIAISITVIATYTAATTVFAFTRCGGVIVYRSKTQVVIALSSTEAEFVTATKTARYLLSKLTEFVFPQSCLASRAIPPAITAIIGTGLAMLSLPTVGLFLHTLEAAICDLSRLIVLNWHAPLYFTDIVLATAVTINNDYLAIAVAFAIAFHFRFVSKLFSNLKRFRLNIFLSNTNDLRRRRSTHVISLDSWATMAKSFSLFVSNPSCCALRIKGGCCRSDLPSYLSYIHMFIIRMYRLSHIHMNYLNHVRQVKTNYYS